MISVYPTYQICELNSKTAEISTSLDLLYLRVLGPDYLAAVVHGDGRLLSAQFDHDSALVVANTESIGPRQLSNTPHPLKAIVQRELQTVCVHVPQPDCTVLRAWRVT